MHYTSLSLSFDDLPSAEADQYHHELRRECSCAARHGGSLQGTTCCVYYSILQYHIAVYRSILQHFTVYYSILQYTTVYHSIFQYIAVYYSILEYATAFYSILQYIAVYYSICKVPDAKYHVKAHETFALWYNWLWSISLQHVREMELREGREHAVDKKTVRK